MSAEPGASPAACAELERALRGAFEQLAREQGVLAVDLRVRCAPLDDQPRFGHAEEARVVERAVPKRQREFATGRRLAHEMLVELGLPSAPLLPDARRAPRWPDGVVGSIAHAAGLVAVAVATRPPFTALGIDIESAEPMSAELIGAVLTARERSSLPLDPIAAGARAKLAFCAKECAYKTWSRDLAAVPEFTDVEIDFDPGRGGFTARLIPRAGAPFEPRMLRGSSGKSGGLVWAASVLAAEREELRAPPGDP